MNEKQLNIFLGSLNESDRLMIAAAKTEDQLMARYHDNKSRLPGGNLLGGTEEEGIAMLRAAKEIIDRTAYK